MAGLDERKWAYEPLDFQSKEAILEDLMNRYGTKVVRLAYTYVKDRAKAEDIAQEVFIKCFERLDQFRGDSGIQTWVYRITVNLCKDYLKSWHVRHVFFGAKKNDISPITEVTPEAAILSRAEQRRLSELVLDLPVKYREIIILYYYEDLSVQDIGIMMDLQENTVKTRLRRARMKLRQLYERSEKRG
ncbi:MAG: sigma-70 family RNA polymerase sigma factor [Tuberibacillus sp.]